MLISLQNSYMPSLRNQSSFFQPSFSATFKEASVATNATFSRPFIQQNQSLHRPMDPTQPRAGLQPQSEISLLERQRLERESHNAILEHEAAVASAMRVRHMQEGIHDGLFFGS